MYSHRPQAMGVVRTISERMATKKYHNHILSIVRNNFGIGLPSILHNYFGKNISTEKEIKTWKSPLFRCNVMYHGKVNEVAEFY